MQQVLLLKKAQVQKANVQKTITQTPSTVQKVEQVKLREEMQKVQNIVNQVQNAFKERSREISKLSSTLHEKETQLRHLEKQTREHSSVLAKFGSSLAFNKVKLSEHEANLKNFQEKFIPVEEAGRELSNAVDSLSTTEKDYMDELSAMNFLFQSLPLEETRINIESIDQLFSKQQLILQELTHKFDLLDSQYNNAVQTREGIHSSILQSESVYHSLENDLGITSHSLEQLLFQIEDEFSRFSQKSMNVQASINTLNSSLTHDEQLLLEIQSQIEELRVKNAHFQQTNESLNQCIRRLETQLQSLKERSDDLSTKLSELNLQLQELNLAIDSQRSLSLTNESQLKEESIAKQSLESQIEEKTSKSRLLQEDIKKSSSSLLLLQQDRDTYKNEEGRLKLEIDRLDQEYELQKTKKLEELHQQEAHLQQQILQLQQKSQIQLSEKQDLQTQFEESKQMALEENLSFSFLQLDISELKKKTVLVWTTIESKLMNLEDQASHLIRSREDEILAHSLQEKIGKIKTEIEFTSSSNHTLEMELSQLRNVSPSQSSSSAQQQLDIESEKQKFRSQFEQEYTEERKRLEENCSAIEKRSTELQLSINLKKSENSLLREKISKLKESIEKKRILQAERKSKIQEELHHLHVEAQEETPPLPKESFQRSTSFQEKRKLEKRSNLPEKPVSDQAFGLKKQKEDPKKTPKSGFQPQKKCESGSTSISQSSTVLLKKAAITIRMPPQEQPSKSKSRKVGFSEKQLDWLMEEDQYLG